MSRLDPLAGRLAEILHDFRVARAALLAFRRPQYYHVITLQMFLDWFAVEGLTAEEERLNILPRVNAAHIRKKRELAIRDKGVFVSCLKALVKRRLYDDQYDLMLSIDPFSSDEFKASYIGGIALNTVFMSDDVLSSDTHLSRYLRRLHVLNDYLNEVFHSVPVIVASYVYFDYPRAYSDYESPTVFVMWDFNLTKKVAIVSNNNLGLCHHISKIPHCLSTFLAWLDPGESTLVCHDCRDAELKDYQRMLTTSFIPAK